MKERWKPVVGFEYFYEVSDAGRVRDRLTQKVLTPKPDGKGYLSILLRSPTKKRRVKIGTMVLEAFVGPKPERMEVRHFPLRDRTCNYLRFNGDACGYPLAGRRLDGMGYRLGPAAH